MRYLFDLLLWFVAWVVIADSLATGVLCIELGLGWHLYFFAFVALAFLLINEAFRLKAMVAVWWSRGAAQ